MGERVTIPQVAARGEGANPRTSVKNLSNTHLHGRLDTGTDTRVVDWTVQLPVHVSVQDSNNGRCNGSSENIFKEFKDTTPQREFLQVAPNRIVKQTSKRISEKTRVFVEQGLTSSTCVSNIA